MVVYFADRRMNILGMATTELMEGFTVSDDLKTEDTDTGVAVFECTVHWTNDTRAIVEAATAAGNYLLRSYDNENEFYTIIESVVDTKAQTVEIYAEDAGMDLLNETVGAFAADEAHPIAWYVEMYAEDTGFEIGINEISDLSRKLEWTGEATAAERIASVATQFDNAEISYTFDIQGLIITHKYINIHKKRGKDAGVQLRLNRDVDRIITTTSVADLATALYVTGGTPENSEDPITLAGYSYDDGDMYVEDGLLKSREALKVWSRYVWAKEPNQIEGYTGHIVKQWSYDTTSQSELCNRAVTQLGKVCEPAVNYEIDIQMLPENVGIGDYVDIVDEKGELYLSSRILQLTTSACKQKQTATLGEFLIVESGISETVRELAEQFSQLAKSRQYYVWIVYADDAEGDGISLDPTGKSYMGTCTTSAGPDPDLSDPTIYKWSLIQGEDGTGIEEIIYWYGKSDSPEEVPTVWQEEPYELLHNEYQWSYVETIYNNGVIELTTPHIIAYYDYLAIDELEARVATIEEAYVSYEEVELLVADDVEAAIINAGFLTADSALIVDLTAFSESVYTLLGGEGSFGELQSIYLSSDNAVIDYAVIANAVAGTLMAELITATYIDTDVITIMSEDGGITIIGNQIQITTGQTLYYDENGNLRIQIGQDESGNFSFIIYDETGTGIMMDSEGIHESAVPDGLIVDSMVATDAAIQGSKLDIESVAQCLTEDGTLELNASQVVINDTTLSAWYTDVTQTLEGLAGLTAEGLMDVEPWFCLWDENTPPADEDLMPAICGEATCGLAVCGMTDGTLWVDHDIEVVDGLYKWVKWKGYYADGHEEWGDPYCLTDGYLRKETSVLQTQLEVVQGQISAKVWMNDITEEITIAITDLWSELSITLDGIEATVGEVSEKSMWNATEYFCLWVSGTSAPPDEITPAICGVAVCGEAICGMTEAIEWATTEPADTEGMYKWIRYLYEYADGHTEWGDPYCLTDDFTREQFETLYGDYLVMETRVSDIEITVEGITSTVYAVTQSIEGIETEFTGVYSQIEQLAESVSIQIGDLQGEISASLVLQINPETGEAEMTGAADTINLKSNRLIIESEGFSLTKDGYILINEENFTLDADGNITASSGVIGDWTITSGLSSGPTSFSDETSGIFIGPDGFCINVASSGARLQIDTFVGELDIRTDSSYMTIGYGAITTNGMQIGNSGDACNITSTHQTDGAYESIRFGYGGTIAVNTPAYIINFGQNPGGLTGRHIFYDDMYCNGALSIDNIKAANSQNYINIDSNLSVQTSGKYTNTSCVQVVGYTGAYSVWLGVGSGGSNRGIYDNTAGRWMIYANSGSETYIRGEDVYVQPETGGYLHVYNSRGDMVIGMDSYGDMGVYDGTNSRWIVRRDSNNRTNLGDSSVATILYGNGVYLNGTSTAVTSDRTFKDNITPFEPEITDNLTDKLTPKIYTVASDPETKHIGFIVDEVEDAMRAAGYDPDEYGLTDSYEDEDGNEMGAIRYDEFIPILLYEIQELRDRVNALENPEEGLIDPGIQLN